MNRYDPLEEMSKHDHSGAEAALIQVWEAMAARAGVTIKVLKQALNRVVFNGYFGPVEDDEYDETEGEHPPGMADSLAILRKAIAADLPVIEYTHPDAGYYCDGTACGCDHPDHDYGLGMNGGMFHDIPVKLDPDDIRKSVFYGLIEIYGHLNI